MEQDSMLVMKALAEYSPPIFDDPNDDEERGFHTLRPEQLQEITQLSYHRAVDACSFLAANSYVDFQETMGHNYYVELTSLGRHQWQSLAANVNRVESEEATSQTVARLPLQPTPVGSPFGFTDQDWEYIEDVRRRKNALKVVVGYQFQSEHYQSEPLLNQLEAHFQQAVNSYNNEPGRNLITLEFKPLRGGLGEHLFNQIARDIISSHIAVFETSDLNPNVMIEMGVALTWDIRVLPIRKSGSPRPPTDISGQTWAEYRENAEQFTDPEFKNNLALMVDRSIRKRFNE